MEGTGIKPIVITEIRELASKYQIEKVILFGSRARGDYRKVSDIDLAVKGGILPDSHWMLTKRLLPCLNMIS